MSIEKRHSVIWALPLDCLQSWMLAKGKEEWHEGILPHPGEWSGLPQSSSQKCTEGWAQKRWTEGSTALPPRGLANPSTIALREMESYALIPSIDVTVASGFNSVNV